MQENLEYWLVVAVARGLGWMPRAAGAPVCRACWPSRCIGSSAGCAAWASATLRWPCRNSPSETRKKILRGVYRHLGWQLVEFCRMTRYTAENTRDWMRTEGLEHYLAAQARGKGVLVLTGHLGAWELSSFYHSLMGYPMGMVIRRLDNRRLDAYVNGIRCLHGNYVLHKDDFGRGLLTAMHAGGTVGILMDTNMTPPQGVFVNFFGVRPAPRPAWRTSRSRPARPCCRASCCGSRPSAAMCCTSARRSEIPQTGDAEADILAATQHATTCSRRGFGAILTSGCGFTAAGRRAPRRARALLGRINIYWHDSVVRENPARQSRARRLWRVHRRGRE